jgi:predicted metal-dependent peptidase
VLAVASNLTVEQRLDKAVVAIMGHPRYVALAGVLMIGERGVRDDVPTACTNGRDEYYGRAFVDGISDTQLRFVILHECYHKMYKHLTTWKHLSDKCQMTANMACDYVINLQIINDNQDGFATGIKGMCIDEKYRGMDSQQVFDLLYEENQQQQGQGSGGEGDDTGDNESDSEGGQPSSPGARNGQQPLDEHDWEGAQSLGEEEKKELAKEIDEAIRQGAMSAGKMGSGGERTVADLLEPQVDWREVLREFITSTCSGSDYATYNRPNRRMMHRGIYMPSGVSEQVDELVVAIDTSGSIGDQEVAIFLTEIKAICETVHPKCVRILYWDTQVCSEEKYDTHELDKLIQSTKPTGGGGTDVNCVTSYMKDNNITPQAAIVLTDGYLYSGWSTWSCPVLWTILDNKQAVPDCGKTVHIKSGDMA